MNDQITEELYKLSHRTKANAVTPLILDYFNLRFMGFNEKDALVGVEALALIRDKKTELTQLL
jgi:hypothetical protein